MLHSLCIHILLSQLSVTELHVKQRHSFQRNCEQNKKLHSLKKSTLIVISLYWNSCIFMVNVTPKIMNAKLHIF